MISMTPRRALAHRMVRPFHEIRRHPRQPGLVYCRTCYIVRYARTVRPWRRS